MKSIFNSIELWFEKLVEYAVKVYGHPVTFILALITIILFLADKTFYRQDFHDIIRDLMLAVTFLSFFIIQKAVNKYTMAVHIKMNELVASHADASNEMVSIENKSEAELTEIAEKHKHIAEDAEDASKDARKEEGKKD